jgi:hypothetical protein
MYKRLSQSPSNSTEEALHSFGNITQDYLYCWAMAVNEVSNYLFPLVLPRKNLN